MASRKETLLFTTMPRDHLWERLHSWRWVPIVVAVSWFTWEWVRIFMAAHGDFPNHWELGRRVISGEDIYADGLNFVYPPFWALFHAPFVYLGSARVAQLIVYPFFILWMFLLIRSVMKFAREQMAFRPKAFFWIVTAALALAGQFVSRDMPEVGTNTMLVALSWLALVLWSERKDFQAGICLGLATALKCTPLLFIAYFALKRQWRVTCYSIAFLTLFTIAPALLMGFDVYNKAMKSWSGSVFHGILEPDPSRGVLGEEKIGNLALRPALARYLMRLPPGHLGRPETSDTLGIPSLPPSKYYIDFLTFSPGTAGLWIKMIMLTMLVAIAWRFRKPPRNRHDPSIVWECAAVSLLILLFSPITWKQHCVGVVPALLLIISRFAMEPKVPRWVWCLMVLYMGLAVFTNREFLGKELMALLDSYKIKTLAILLLLGLMITWRSWFPLRGPNETYPYEENREQAIS